MTGQRGGNIWGRTIFLKIFINVLISELWYLYFFIIKFAYQIINWTIEVIIHCEVNFTPWLAMNQDEDEDEDKVKVNMNDIV